MCDVECVMSKFVMLSVMLSVMSSVRCQCQISFRVGMGGEGRGQVSLNFLNR